MSSARRVIAIIPARGGSKRIPHKNIRSFHGKPIIQYAIEAAQKSRIFDEVMVSTDSSKIAVIARKAGAQVPFLRSSRTAHDRATVSEAIIEVLCAYEKTGRTFDYFASIMATAAFVTPARLRQADAMMRSLNADSVVAVTRFDFPIQRALCVKNGKISLFSPKHFYTRSQDLEPAYHDCGQFFFSKTKAFLADKRALNDKTYAFEIPRSETQDIDSEEDWRIAELKFRQKKR